MVVEADESDRSFLNLEPEVAVAHERRARPPLDLRVASSRCARRSTSSSRACRPAGTVVAWEGAGRLRRAWSSASRPARRCARATCRPPARGCGSRSCVDGEDVCEVTLPVPGRAQRPERARGDRRRARGRAATPRGPRGRSRPSSPPAAASRPKGEAGGVRVFDDYAHHATEVAATLAAARALEPRRLVAVFQPHLYSRTAPHAPRPRPRARARRRGRGARRVPRARERPEDYPRRERRAGRRARRPTTPAGARCGGCRRATRRWACWPAGSPRATWS